MPARKNPDVFDQVVAIIIVKEGMYYLNLCTHSHTAIFNEKVCGQNFAIHKDSALSHAHPTVIVVIYLNMIQIVQ